MLALPSNLFFSSPASALPSDVHLCSCLPQAMRPPLRGGRGGRSGFRGAAGAGGFRGISHGDRRGGFGGRGGGYDEGPPEEVVEVASYLHGCEGEAVTRLTNEKIPYFNAPIYLENKTQIGKVEEIFGPINEAMFSVKMQEGIIATSYKTGDKFYIDPAKLLPLARFLPQSKGTTPGGGRGCRGGGRGGRVEARGGGRGGFSVRGGRGFRGARGGGRGFGGRNGGFGGRNGGGFRGRSRS